VPDVEQQFFVKLMLDAGLRWQEAAGLHHFRVDVRRRRVRIQEVAERDGSIKPQPKSKAGGRWVPLTEELVSMYLELYPASDREGLVFKGDTEGRALDYSNWARRTWAPAIAAAGLADPQPTPHDCRHSYGSWLAEGGVPAHEIKDLMGHGSLRAVERYIHSSEARLDRAREALGARVAHGAESQQRKPRSPGRETGA
jgi:integrase